MKTVRLNCFGLVMALLSVNVFALHPWKKACSDECKNNHKYKIVKGAVFCADCGSPVAKPADAIPVPKISKKYVVSTRNEGTAANPAKYLRITHGASEFSETLTQSVHAVEAFDIEKLWILRLLRGGDTRQSLGDYLAKPGPKSPHHMYRSWVGRTGENSVFDEFTQTVFSSWTGEDSFHVEQRARLPEIDKKFFLPHERLQTLAFQAMVIQDMLVEDRSLGEYNFQAPGFLLKLISYLIDINQDIFSREERIQRGLDAVQTEPSEESEPGTTSIASSVSTISSASSASSASTQSYNTDSRASKVTTLDVDTISHKFGGMQFKTQYQELAKNTCIWDKRENDFISETGLDKNDVFTFRTILSEGQRLIYDGVGLNRDAMLTIDSYCTNSGLVFNADSLFRADSREELFGTISGHQSLMTILDRMMINMVIHIAIDNIVLIIRKSTAGYTIYAPLFWSTFMANSQQAEDFIKYFLASLAESTKKAAIHAYKYYKEIERKKQASEIKPAGEKTHGLPINSTTSSAREDSRSDKTTLRSAGQAALQYLPCEYQQNCVEDFVTSPQFRSLVIFAAAASFAVCTMGRHSAK